MSARYETRGAVAVITLDNGAVKGTAIRFFFGFELPRIDTWLEIVAARSTLCRDMPVDAYRGGPAWAHGFKSCSSSKV